MPYGIDTTVDLVQCRPLKSSPDCTSPDTGSEQLTITNFEYVYFSMITMTTVGYGDFVPGDQFGRAIAAFEAISGYVVLAALVTALSYIGRRDTR